MLESQPAIYSETLCALCYLGCPKKEKKKNTHHARAIANYPFREKPCDGEVTQIRSNLKPSLCLKGERSSCPAAFNQDVVTTDMTCSPPSC